MVQSFGRPAEPVEEPAEGVPFPVIHLPVIPYVDAAGLAVVAAQIQATVADAVRAGFVEGFEAANAASPAAASPNGECAASSCGCVDTAGGAPGR